MINLLTYPIGYIQTFIGYYTLFALEDRKMGGYQAREKNQQESILWEPNKKNQSVEFSNPPREIVKPRRLKFDQNGKIIRRV